MLHYLIFMRFFWLRAKVSQQTISEIRKGSELLTSMEKDGKIKIVSAMYYLNSGKVEFE